MCQRSIDDAHHRAGSRGAGPIRYAYRTLAGADRRKIFSRKGGKVRRWGTRGEDGEQLFCTRVASAVSSGKLGEEVNIVIVGEGKLFGSGGESGERNPNAANREEADRGKRRFSG